MVTKFILTPSQIENGLTDKDFSEYAGIPVFSGYFDDFPQEKRERTKALHSAVNKGLPDGVELSLEDAESLAEKAGPCCRLLGTKTDLVPPLNIHKHFQNLLKYGVDNAIDGISPGSLIIPGSLDEYMKCEGTEKPLAAFVLRFPRSVDALTDWQFMSGLPKQWISKYAKDKIFHLIVDLHELRHSAQEMLITPFCITKDYYNEFDADLFARSMLRQATVGDEASKAYLNSRYLGMLTANDEKYWFAPAMEALEAGQTPPPFPEISKAVTNIRRQLFFSLVDDKHASYAPSADEMIRANWPYRTLSHLQHIISEKKLDNPLAQKISERIVTAAKYFCDDIVFTAYISSRSDPQIPKEKAAAAECFDRNGLMRSLPPMRMQVPQPSYIDPCP